MTDNITLPRAVVEQVREALESYRGQVSIYGDSPAADVCTILAAALAEPEQKPEPVAWLVKTKDGRVRTCWTSPPSYGQVDLAHFDGDTVTPLYAAPPEPDATREPATVEQVIEANGPPWGPSASPAFFSGWRAAERFHGIITKEDKP